MVFGVWISIQVYPNTAGAAEHPVIESIVTIVLCSDIRKELAEHWDEKSKLLGKLLKIDFHSDVADSVGWLIKEMDLDIADHLHFTVSERNLLGDIAEAQSWEHGVILKLLLVSLQICGFFDDVRDIIFR